MGFWGSFMKIASPLLNAALSNKAGSLLNANKAGTGPTGLPGASPDSIFVNATAGGVAVQNVNLANQTQAMEDFNEKSIELSGLKTDPATMANSNAAAAASFAKLQASDPSAALLHETAALTAVGSAPNAAAIAKLPKNVNPTFEDTTKAMLTPAAAAQVNANMQNPAMTDTDKAAMVSLMQNNVAAYRSDMSKGGAGATAFTQTVFSNATQIHEATAAQLALSTAGTMQAGGTNANAVTPATTAIAANVQNTIKMADISHLVANPFTQYTAAGQAATAAAAATAAPATTATTAAPASTWKGVPYVDDSDKAFLDNRVSAALKTT